MEALAADDPSRVGFSRTIIVAETVSGGQFDWGGRLLKVNEALKGSLRGVEIIRAAKHSKFTARPASPAGRETDSVIRWFRMKGHRSTDKSYPGRGLFPKSSHRREVSWHLDVGSSHPGGCSRSQGWAVRPLKRYASWVQNVVRQFGPYRRGRSVFERGAVLVREDRDGHTSGVPVVVPRIAGAMCGRRSAESI